MVNNKSSTGSIGDEAHARDRRATLQRREYLGAAGASLAAIAAGVPTTAAARENRINVVEAGADPTGEENVVPLLDELLEDGVTLFFPGGDYLVESPESIDEIPDNVGWWPELTQGLMESIELRGTDGTTFVCEDPDIQYLLVLGPVNPTRVGRDADPATLVFDNFTFDFTKEKVGPKALTISARERLEVTNIKVEGQIPGEPENGASGSVPILEPRVYSEDGVGRVNLVARDGGTFTPEKFNNPPQRAFFNHPFAINMHSMTTGTVYFENCDIRNFVNTAMYLRGSGGTSHVRNCYYKNNGGTNLRLDYGDTAKNITIEMTGEGPAPEAPMTGLRHERGAPVSENVKIVATGGHPNSDPVRLAGGTLRNANVRADVISAYSAGRDQAAIRNSSGSPEHAVTLENVTVWDDLENRPEDFPGRADTGKAISLDYDSSDEEASDHVILNCCVEQSERGGIRLDSGLIENTTIVVPDDEEALDVTDEVELVDVEFEGACSPDQNRGASRDVFNGARPSRRSRDS